MLNKAQIIGRVGNDPEVRYMPSGEAAVNISLATTEKWKDKQTGEAKESTEWHRINFFGRLAEIVAEYAQKGTLLYVEGKIKTRKWKDKEGIEKYSTEIYAETIKLLSSKTSSQPTHEEKSPSQDDVPF